MVAENHRNLGCIIRFVQAVVSFFICIGLRHQATNFGNTELVAVVSPQFLIAHTFLLSSLGS